METSRIDSLKAKIADLKRQWPAHSVPPAMLQELDDLEEMLRKEIEKLNAKKAVREEHDA